VKYITFFACLLLLPAFWGGAAYQNHKDATTEAAYADSTVAIVGVVICGHMVAVLTVDGSGKVVPRPGMTAQDAVTLAKSLPTANGGLVTIPCPVRSEALPPQTET